MEPFLSHSIRLVLSDTVVILGQSYPSYHHFSRAHVRSLIHPHGVILELSRQTRHTSFYTRAYFPLLVVEMIVFSQTCYNLHYPGKGYLFALLVTLSVIFIEMSLQQSATFGFWLSHYLWPLSGLLCWGSGICPSKLFSWEPHWIIHLRWRWIPPA